MHRTKWAIIVKSNAGYICQQCGSTELLQAHDPTGEHIDVRDGICLCVDCHSEKHPGMPKGLFLNSRCQPYWQNISASSLGRLFGCCSRTIIRWARKLDIGPGFIKDEGIGAIEKRTAIYIKEQRKEERGKALEEKREQRKEERKEQRRLFYIGQYDCGNLPVPNKPWIEERLEARARQEKKKEKRQERLLICGL